MRATWLAHRSVSWTRVSHHSYEFPMYRLFWQTPKSLYITFLSIVRRRSLSLLVNVKDTIASRTDQWIVDFHSRSKAILLWTWEFRSVHAYISLWQQTRFNIYRFSSMRQTNSKFKDFKLICSLDKFSRLLVDLVPISTNEERTPPSSGLGPAAGTLTCYQQLPESALYSNSLVLF